MLISSTMPLWRYSMDGPVRAVVLIVGFLVVYAVFSLFISDEKIDSPRS